MTGFLRCWVAVLVALLLLEPPIRAADTLADRLSRLDPTVAPPGERKALAGMVADVVRARQELDDRHTAAWNGVRSRADWEKFRAPAGGAAASLGSFPAAPRSLAVRIRNTLSGEGFRIDNLAFESRKGLWVTANLYRPDKPAASMPGILICHAHHTPKEHGELQDMGMTWARAGCCVLVMDQLGHGERRQHPFVDDKSYPKPFRVSRQDYHFRYDSGIQLHTVGDSLIGWMVWDLMRGVDLLLAQKGIDPARILLLGAVAGGGDPAAVAAALDERIACVAPFNFGGPSPAPQYPFPADKEPRWNYSGGGKSWESTRNLRRSALDGFQRWVIPAAVAPRRFVYAHEFGWYRDGDPVWKRLQAVFGFYSRPDHLAFTFGKGDVSKKPPEGTHCTHIGALHRKMMHEAFHRWFGIDVDPDKEYRNRLPSDQLRCLSADLRPGKLSDLLGELAEQRMAEAGKRRQGKSSAEQRRMLQAEWTRILGEVRPSARLEARRVGSDDGLTVERILLKTEPGITVPLLLLLPPAAKGKKAQLVVAVAQAGKAALLRARAAEIAALLEGGAAVCLPDVRGTGETGLGEGRGRTSAATALSSSQLMLGERQVGNQLRDLRAVLSWLRTRDDLATARLAVWGDSLAPTNPPDTRFAVPRDDDAALPRQSEPLGGLLALLAGLYEDGVQAVYVRGGLSGFRSVLDSHLVLIPHDAVLPGALTAGDLADVAAALAPRPVRLEGLVDSGNRALGERQVRAVYQRALDVYRDRGAANALSLREKPSSVAGWLLAQLRAKE